MVEKSDVFLLILGGHRMEVLESNLLIRLTVVNPISFDEGLGVIGLREWG